MCRQKIQISQSYIFANGFKEKPYHVNNEKVANQNLFVFVTRLLFWKQGNVLNEVCKNGHSFFILFDHNVK